MKELRRDLQIVGDAQTKPAPEAQPAWRNIFSIGKDLLPFLTMIIAAIYGFGVKSSTSDRLQQQIQEDHIAIQTMREKTSEISGKVDLIVAEIFREHRDGAK
jgi:hypothetical protein